VKKKSANVRQIYKQERGCRVHFLCLLVLSWPCAQSARDNHIFALTLPSIHRFKKITDRLSNKPFLIWLLTTPPHLKYVATLPCNLSLIAYFLTLTSHMKRLADF